jgi:hypothetical protein
MQKGHTRNTIVEAEVTLVERTQQRCVEPFRTAVDEDSQGRQRVKAELCIVESGASRQVRGMDARAPAR